MYPIGDIFEKSFPYYLAIGMTPEQYWEGSSWLAWAYREAYKLKQEQDNVGYWMQGMYIYNGVRGAIVETFGKVEEPTYPTEPFDFYKRKERQAERQVLAEKAKMEKGMGYMMAFMNANKEGGVNNE